MRKPISLLSFFFIFILVTFILNSQPAGLSLGSTAPDFSARDQYGKDVSLYNLLGKGPVILVFYRGAWCPYCNRHMNDLQDSIAYIQQKGASVVAVTPEKPENIQKTVSKTGAAFSVLHDKNHSIMDLYKTTYEVPFFNSGYHYLTGVDFKKWNGSEEKVLPVPATYIISPERIIFARHFDPDNIKIRMSVLQIVGYLDRMSLRR